MAEDEAARNEAWGHDPEASGLGSEFDQMWNNTKAHKSGSELTDNTSGIPTDPDDSGRGIAARHTRDQEDDEDDGGDPWRPRVTVTAPKPSDFYARSADAASRAFQDAISMPILSVFGNGNITSKLYPQDDRCTVPFCGPAMDSNPNIKRRCIVHDGCYAENGCNASSWVATFLDPLGSKPCVACNRAAFGPILFELYLDAILAATK